MGLEDSTKAGIFSTKTTLKNRSTIFSLGGRGQVLTDLLEEPIIVPHTSQKTDKRVRFILKVLKKVFVQIITA